MISAAVASPGETLLTKRIRQDGVLMAYIDRIDRLLGTSPPKVIGHEVLSFLGEISEEVCGEERTIQRRAGHAVPGV